MQDPRHPATLQTAAHFPRLDLTNTSPTNLLYKMQTSNATPNATTPFKPDLSRSITELSSKIRAHLEGGNFVEADAALNDLSLLDPDNELEIMHARG